MRARKCAEVSRRARRISRKVFRHPFGTLCVCRSSMRRDPFSSFPYASGRGRWLPRGLARGDGVGHAPLLERVRPVRSLLLGVLSARREGCAGGAGQWLDRGTPGKWPACRKKRRKRPGGDAPGPQRPPSGAHAEKRDMLAMSVKLAGSGARVHVRRVSRARANARMRVMTHPPTPRTIFFFGKTVVGHVARAFFRTLPLFRARGGRHGGRHGGPRPSRVRRVRGRRLRDPHGQDRTRAAVSYMHGCVRRRDGHAMRPLLLRHVHHVQHPAQKAVSAV